MDNLRGIIHYHADDEYGSIKVKLAEVMDSQGITRNRLRELTGTKYDVITRYYKGDSVQMVDLDFLSKVCYVLNCRMEDLLEYHPPENQER